VTLDFWSTPVDLSDPGAQARLFDGLPRDAAGLVKVVQGLLMHEHIASAYGLTLSADQHEQAHTRPVEAMLENIAAHDPRPLSTARPPGERQIGVCRHFTLMHVAMLRYFGVPARARCGFGAYFQKGKFLDHWVTEYWNADTGRWMLVDAQLDARQRELFKVAFDPLDVPRDQFLVAGDAWHLHRSGKAQPDDFCILDLKGVWLIAGNLMRDVAALNNREMLPWDCWDPMPWPGAEVDLARFDRLAPLSSDPDAHDAEVRAVYSEGFAVPRVVMNAVRNRRETV
jgi:Transglutaminase-like superfamily